MKKEGAQGIANSNKLIIAFLWLVGELIFAKLSKVLSNRFMFDFEQNQEYESVMRGFDGAVGFNIIKLEGCFIELNGFSKVGR